MRATLTPEQVEIERTMREIGANGRAEARACLEHGYRATHAESTLLGDYSALGLQEAFGTGMIEVAVALEALGRTLVPSHLAGQLAAVQVAAAAGLDVTPAIDGGERWALAVDEAREGLDDLSLSATKAMVAVPGTPDALVVAGEEGVAVVRGGEGATSAGAATTPSAAAEDASRAGLDFTPRPGLDATRPFAEASVDAEPQGELSDGLERALVVVAADLCGAAAGALALGAEYARDRVQFGKPIGSFQGIAFQLADALAAVKEAWDLCLYAAWAIDVGAPDATLCAHQAKGTAARSALFAAERTVQVHGGIGITIEADPHLYLRRALSGGAWLGSGRWHDRRAGALRVAAAAVGHMTFHVCGSRPQRGEQ